MSGKKRKKLANGYLQRREFVYVWSEVVVLWRDDIETIMVAGGRGFIYIYI